MPFQTTIGPYPAPGIPGMVESLNPNAYTVPVNPLADGDVLIGSFVWRSTDKPGFAMMGGTGKPWGLVERVQDLWLGYNEEATMTAKDGQRLTVAISGDYWVNSNTVATIGQKAFVNPTTGAIGFADAGGSVADSIETDWTAQTALTEAPGLVVISWWGQGA